MTQTTKISKGWIKVALTGGPIKRIMVRRIFSYAEKPGINGSVILFSGERNSTYSVRESVEEIDSLIRAAQGEEAKVAHGLTTELQKVQEDAGHDARAAAPNKPEGEEIDFSGPWTYSTGACDCVFIENGLVMIGVQRGTKCTASLSVEELKRDIRSGSAVRPTKYFPPPVPPIPQAKAAPKPFDEEKERERFEEWEKKSFGGGLTAYEDRIALDAWLARARLEHEAAKTSAQLEAKA